MSVEQLILHKYKLTAGFGRAPGMVAGKVRMDRDFSTRYRLGFIHNLLSHKMLWQQSVKMWPCAVFAESCGAKKALEHPLPPWFQLCPQADIYHQGLSSWSSVQLSAQPSSTQIADAPSRLWFNASPQSECLGRNPKAAASPTRLCSKIPRLPALLPTTHPDTGLTHDDSSPQPNFLAKVLQLLWAHT